MSPYYPCTNPTQQDTQNDTLHNQLHGMQSHTTNSNMVTHKPVCTAEQAYIIRHEQGKKQALHVTGRTILLHTPDCTENCTKLRITTNCTKLHQTALKTAPKTRRAYRGPTKHACGLRLPTKHALLLYICELLGPQWHTQCGILMMAAAAAAAAAAQTR